MVMAKKIKKPKQAKVTDSNLPLISIILGGASIFGFLLLFAGIPAIILGIRSLHKKAGNQTLAKLGITFGIIGSLLTIPVAVLAFHLLRQPINEQFGILDIDRSQIVEIADSLNEYKKKAGKYPLCADSDTETSCADWQLFSSSYPNLTKYPMEFESESYSVEDRPTGTLIYVNRSACFLGTPTSPGYLDDNAKNIDQTKFASLVFFHAKGRSCFDVHKP